CGRACKADATPGAHDTPTAARRRRARSGRLVGRLAVQRAVTAASQLRCRSGAAAVRTNAVREAPGRRARAGIGFQDGEARRNGRFLQTGVRQRSRLWSNLAPEREGAPMRDDVSQMPVIDVDSHWTEPRDLWTSRAPAKLKDRALRVQKNAAGVEQWVIEDGQVMGQVGYASIRPGGSKTM